MFAASHGVGRVFGMEIFRINIVLEVVPELEDGVHLVHVLVVETREATQIVSNQVWNIGRVHDLKDSFALIELAHPSFIFARIAAFCCVTEELRVNPLGPQGLFNERDHRIVVDQ